MRARSGESYCGRGRYLEDQRAAAYAFVNPFRVFVTVYEPSCSAARLIQNAAPLCAGGGVAVAPGCGAGAGARGRAAGRSSKTFAMNMPGTVYSWPLSSEKWICHRSSSPGEEKIVFITSGSPPLRVPLFMMMTRGRTA